MSKHITANIKNFILLSFLLLLFILLSAISYVEAVSYDLQESVFRLHVIANSNSIEDQSLKYIVRDSILEYINNLTKNTTSKKEIIDIVNKNSNTIKSIAEQTIIDNGYNYNVNIEIGKFIFPTKTYGDISFPTGCYDALKVEIGNSNGENWWCVMFPPLCFVDVTSGIVPEESKEVLQDSLLEEEYKIISDNSSSTKIKFKIIEMLQNINTKINT